LNVIEKISKKNELVNKKTLAFDIDPKNEKIFKKNFLTLNLKNKYLKKNNFIIIGNPPFGRRGDIALKFINKSFEISETVGFILPLIFRKWSIQSKLDKNLKLVFDTSLNPKSFFLKNKIRSLNTCFQIWTKKKYYIDLRLKDKPITKHSDFKMYLHNNTKKTLKFFQKNKYKWNFAVVRQGFYDYNEKILNVKDLFKNRQYIFFKSKNEKVNKKLLSINFIKLSKKNTIIPGFGKNDVIIAYNSLKKC